MSKYENYTVASNHYDNARAAIGSEIWLGALASKFDNPKDIRLLDAGCGTGNYSMALANHVGQISALDMNEGMLAKAKAKAANLDLNDKITFYQGQLPDLPFEDNSHNVVMFNQVLHHLEINDSDEFIGLGKAIKEAGRVLREGGLLLINACSRAQIERAYWYYSLIPQAMQKSLRATISTYDLQMALADNGFGNVSRCVTLDEPLLGEANFQAGGPLDPSWRAADSIWAFATSDELDAALGKVEGLSASGALSKFMTEHDATRQQIGQTVFWCAVNEN